LPFVRQSKANPSHRAGDLATFRSDAPLQTKQLQTSPPTECTTRASAVTKNLFADRGCEPPFAGDHVRKPEADYRIDLRVLDPVDEEAKWPNFAGTLSLHNRVCKVCWRNFVTGASFFKLQRGAAVGLHCVVNRFMQWHNVDRDFASTQSGRAATWSFYFVEVASFAKRLYDQVAVPLEVPGGCSRVIPILGCCRNSTFECPPHDRAELVSIKGLGKQQKNKAVNTLMLWLLLEHVSIRVRVCLVVKVGILR
jgi:hypothetical protein